MTKIENLILCPLKFELSMLIQSFATKPVSIGRHSGHYSAELRCFFANGGHGKVAMALNAQSLINQLPDLQRAFCVGIAGGLSPELSVGDLMVAEKIIEHDFKVGFAKKRSPQFRTDSELLTIVQNLGLPTGIICSGDEDICSRERAEELRKQFSGDAVAWEGAGFARACRQTQLPFLEIRAISDSCEILEDFPARLEKAMARLGPAIRSLLEQVQEAPL